MSEPIVLSLKGGGRAHRARLVAVVAGVAGVLWAVAARDAGVLAVSIGVLWVMRHLPWIVARYVGVKR